MAPEPHPVASRLVAEWRAIREALAELDRQAHPDITDAMGRVWTWKWDDSSGSHYRHCGRLVPVERIPSVGTATQAMLDNPNYDLCEVCVDGRERHVRVCDPEWKCRHAICAEASLPD